jgi:hypothetical protein
MLVFLKKAKDLMKETGVLHIYRYGKYQAFRGHGLGPTGCWSQRRRHRTWLS